MAPPRGTRSQAAQGRGTAAGSPRRQGAVDRAIRRMLATPTPVGVTAFAVCGVTLLRLILEEAATAGEPAALPARAVALAAFLLALHALYVRALRRALPGPAPGAGILVAIALGLALLSPILALAGVGSAQPGVAGAQRLTPFLVDPVAIPVGVSLALVASVLWLLLFAARRGASAVALVQAGLLAWAGLALLLHVEWLATHALGMAASPSLQAQLLALLALLLYAPRRVRPFALLLVALAALLLRGHDPGAALSAAGALGFLFGDRPVPASPPADGPRVASALSSAGHRSLALLVLVLALLLHHALLGLVLLLGLLLTRSAIGQALRVSAPALPPALPPALRLLRLLPLALVLALLALTPPLP